MNSVTAKFHLRDWPRVPKRQRQAFVVLLLCAAFFFASCGSVVMLLVWDARHTMLPTLDMAVQAAALPASEPESTPQEAEPFPGGALPRGEDAGEAYLSETVWLGDSNTVRMYLLELVPLENYMAVEGLGIEGFAEVPCVSFVGDSKTYTIAEAVRLVQPRRVVMTFGTNNVEGNFTCEEFIALYGEAVAALRQAAPDCDIIVNAIPPVGEVRAYPDVSMETIDLFNTALEAFCLDQHLAFLRSHEALKGKNGFAQPEYLVEDGLHMSEAGLRTLMQYLREHPLVTHRQGVAHSGAPQRSPPQFFLGTSE